MISDKIRFALSKLIMNDLAKGGELKVIELSEATLDLVDGFFNSEEEENIIRIEANDVQEIANKINKIAILSILLLSGCSIVVYNKDTPAPWANVIANKKFGTIITNNGCGFTYAYNSGEFKITSWTNEMVVNDKSEGFRFNGKVFVDDYYSYNNIQQDHLNNH